MQETINSLITKFFQVQYRKQLPSYSGTYTISPRPPYISQFIGIYHASITIDTPLTDTKQIKAFGAKDSKEFTFWTWRDCGIACVKMMLEAKGKAKDKTLMELTNEGIQLGGYILYENDVFVDKGWFHHSLVALLKKYGIQAQMKKWQTIESVAKDILENKLVMLSVFVPGRRFIKEDGSFEPKPNAKWGGHLLLATGVKMIGKEITGVSVHDPRGLEKYQKDTFVSKEAFNTIFTSRTIVAS